MLKSNALSYPQFTGDTSLAELKTSKVGCQRGERQLFTRLNVALSDGELLLVKGPNGCGKTSLLRILCGLLEPTRGTVYWNNVTIDKLGIEFQQQLLYVGHKKGIKDGLTVLENLELAHLNGEPRENINVNAILEQFQLARYENVFCHNLSAGQRQRVALARLLLIKAKLWILDEPFTAVDKGGVESMKSIFASHCQSGGMIVLTTHQEVELSKFAIKTLNLDANDS